MTESAGPADRLRLRCWELEVALDWYLQRIHELEAALTAGGPMRAEPPRPKIVASGDDAAQRHFERIRLYEMEIQALTASMEQQEKNIADLSRALDVQRSAAEDRLRAVEELSRERDLHADVAAERLRALEDISSTSEQTIAALQEQLALQSQAAAERLEMLEAVARDRDVQAEAAAERLSVIEQLRGVVISPEQEASVEPD